MQKMGGVRNLGTENSAEVHMNVEKYGPWY